MKGLIRLVVPIFFLWGLFFAPSVSTVATENVSLTTSLSEYKEAKTYQFTLYDAGIIEFEQILWSIETHKGRVSGKSSSKWFDVTIPDVDYNSSALLKLKIKYNSGEVLELTESLRVIDYVTIIPVKRYDKNKEIVNLSKINGASDFKLLSDIGFELLVDSYGVVRFTNSLPNSTCNRSYNVLFSFNVEGIERYKVYQLVITCLELSPPPGFYNEDVEVTLLGAKSFDNLKVKVGHDNIFNYEKPFQIEKSTRLEYWTKGGNSKVQVRYFIKEKFGVVAENGVTLWLNQPSSARFIGKFDRTYFTWVEDSKIKIRYLNNRTKIWSEVVTVKEWEGLNDHSTATIHISETGKIMLFYSHHSSPLFTRVSNLSEDITTWQDELILDPGEVTYPQVFSIEENKIGVLYRYKKSENPEREESLRLLVSHNGGEDWEKTQEIISFGPEYWVYSLPPKVINGDIYLLWNIYSSAERKYKDVYFTKSIDGGRTWKGIGGLFFNFLNIENSVKLIDSSKEAHLRLWDMNVYNKGDIVNFTYISNLDKSNDFTNAYLGRLIGNSVTSYLVSKTPKTYYSSGIILHPNKEGYVLYSPYDKCGSKCLIGKKLLNGTLSEVTRIDTNAKGKASRYQFIKNDTDYCLTWLDVKSYKLYTDFETALMTNCDKY